MVCKRTPKVLICRNKDKILRIPIKYYFFVTGVWFHRTHFQHTLEFHECPAAPISAVLHRVATLIANAALVQVSGRTTHEPFSWTNPFTPSTRLYKQQIPFSSPQNELTGNLAQTTSFGDVCSTHCTTWPVLAIALGNMGVRRGAKPAFLPLEIVIKNKKF